MPALVVSRYSGGAMMRFHLLIGGLAVIFGLSRLPTMCAAQSASTLELFRKGPHQGPVEEALVIVEATNFDESGIALPTRCACGVIFRCDGFVLTASDLFLKTTTLGRTHAKKGTFRVISWPDQKVVKAFTANAPYCIAEGVGFTALKAPDFHQPSAILHSPGRLQTGA